MINEYKAILAKAKNEAKKLKNDMILLGRKKGMTILKRFHLAHEDVFEEIDCKLCGNCCKQGEPLVITPDIMRLSKLFRMKKGPFTDKYLKTDRDENWTFNQMPCPFLGEENHCTVYDDKPRSCRDYPFTHDRDTHKRLKTIGLEALNCPAAYLIAKRVIKETLGDK